MSVSEALQKGRAPRWVKIIVKFTFYVVTVSIFFFWTERIPDAPFWAHFGLTLATCAGLILSVALILTPILGSILIYQAVQVRRGKRRRIDLIDL
ncbi:MAG: hypothetical protein KF784_14940 [Fimbriimonadaceae bacterium]|nr:hypothetical protein [Fimbriimonadaceae bacterium]